MLSSCCDECCGGCPELGEFKCTPDTTILLPISKDGQEWISSFVSDTLSFEYHLGGEVQYTLNSLTYDTVEYNPCDTAWQSLQATIKYDLVSDSLADSSLVIRLATYDLRSKRKAREYLQFETSSGFNAFFFIDDSTEIDRDLTLRYHPFLRTFGRAYWEVFYITDNDLRNVNTILFSKSTGFVYIRGYPGYHNPLIRKE